MAAHAAQDAPHLATAAHLHLTLKEKQGMQDPFARWGSSTAERAWHAAAPVRCLYNAAARGSAARSRLLTAGPVRSPGSAEPSAPAATDQADLLLWLAFSAFIGLRVSTMQDVMSGGLPTLSRLWQASQAAHRRTNGKPIGLQAVQWQLATFVGISWGAHIHPGCMPSPSCAGSAPQEWHDPSYPYP